MKHHTIELKDLQDWLEEAEMTFASSTREYKRLVATARGGLKVTVAGKTVWEGMQPFPAMEAYNAITEKYVNENKDFKL
jgi:hypothetical protein